MAQKALDMLNVDKDGLDTLDRRYLSMLLERFEGRPTGVEALAAAMAEDSGTLGVVFGSARLCDAHCTWSDCNQYGLFTIWDDTARAEIIRALVKIFFRTQHLVSKNKFL